MTERSSQRDGVASPREDTRSASGPGLIIPQGEPLAIADIREAQFIKEGDLFLMTDEEGNLPPAQAAYGLYRGDTRHLSVYDLTLDDVRPTVLLSTAELGFGSEQHLTNPRMTVDSRVILKDSIEVTRRRVVNKSLVESIRVTNFAIERTRIALRLRFAADFADMFEVRGETRPRRGKLFPPEVRDDRVIFAYEGLDGVRRTTELIFSPAPEIVSADGARFTLDLGHRESVSIHVTIIPNGDHIDASFGEQFDTLAASYRDWISSCTRVFTSNDFVNAMLERSLTDLRMLRVEDGDGGFIAAGTPWFSSLFGRDSLITALQMLAFNPKVAERTLRVLARWQGRNPDDWRDEEPGKILHELRTGEMAATDEIPMTPYYGSVDSTPLFLLLASEYVAWTGDMQLVRELEPSLMAAREWVRDQMGPPESGYLSYSKRSSKGLLNQGWKDSHNGIVAADGSLVESPIALAEVQGYVYAAYQGLAGLVERLDRSDLAEELRRDAAALKSRFNRDFWVEDLQFFALALAGRNEPAAVVTSNPAQGLWTGIVDKSRAAALVDRLCSSDMFSGWGIRTLSSHERRYNPLGYHLGTVWPHDNSLIGMGLRRYGFEEALNRIVAAIYDSARSFEYHRLPELFSGVPRTPHSEPVRYPVASRPQAWAAGAFPLLLQAILGLVPNALEGRLTVVKPRRLPPFLEYVEVRGLRVGGASVDLRYETHPDGTQVSVLETDGVDVVVVDEWPEDAP